MYVPVKGRWPYSYRVLDDRGETIDFLLLASGAGLIVDGGMTAAYGR
jgi:hypothetical protein